MSDLDGEATGTVNTFPILCISLQDVLGVVRKVHQCALVNGPNATPSLVFGTEVVDASVHT